MDLSSQLLAKGEQNKALEERNQQLSDQVKEHLEAKKKVEADLEDQKVAYEILLDQISDGETTAGDLRGQVESLENKLKESIENNTKLEEECKRLTEENKGLQKQIDKQIREMQRNSIGSDGDEYSSVAEMKESLKHAREMLSQFLQKLPYSDPANEVTLPIIMSMFEFTKQEQDKMTEARKAFN